MVLLMDMPSLVFIWPLEGDHSRTCMEALEGT
jgi:hypothetical protein